MPNADGYPTDAELERVQTWPETDPAGWLAYVKTLWHWPDWGWSERGSQYLVSTGGWSGNEDIVAAMQEHAALWRQVWYATRRGGHYTFEIDA